MFLKNFSVSADELSILLNSKSLSTVIFKQFQMKLKAQSTSSYGAYRIIKTLCFITISTLCLKASQCAELVKYTHLLMTTQALF